MLALRDTRLYLCTDARLDTGDFADFVDAAYAGGVDIIQLRDRALEARRELEFFEILAATAERHRRHFAANDRADIATLAGAHILHIGQGDLPPEDAKRLTPTGTLVGLSTHATDQAAAAARDDAVDYVCIGPIRATPTKPGRPGIGIEPVREVARAAERDERERRGAKPWFAIGDINEQTINEVVDAGATRVVVVRAITEAKDPAEAAARLRAALP